MEEDNSVCVICENSLSSGEVVKVSKGLNTLYAASISRNDGLHNKFKDIGYVIVHVNCRKNYTRKSTIKKVSNTSANILSGASTSRSSIRTIESFFNFKRDCLFCGEEASAKIEMKKSSKYRKKVHQVATLEIKNSIIKLAEQRNDEWGQIVLTRVKSVLDLVAADCKYHNTCLSKFRKPITFSKIGRPADDKKREAFEKLCTYIEMNDECQYSFMEIIEQMKMYLDGDEVCSTKQLKKLFKDKYGDRVTFTEGNTGHDKEVIMTFKDSFNKLLYKSWFHKNENEKEERLRIVSMAAKIIKEDI